MSDEKTLIDLTAQLTGGKGAFGRFQEGTNYRFPKGSTLGVYMPEGIEDRVIREPVIACCDTVEYDYYAFNAKTKSPDGQWSWPTVNTTKGKVPILRFSIPRNLKNEVFS